MITGRRRTNIIRVRYRRGTCSRRPVHHLWSAVNEIVVLWAWRCYAVSSVRQLAGAISLDKTTCLVHPPHRHRAAKLYLLVWHPQSVPGDVMTQEMVELWEMVGFHAITVKVSVGTGSRWGGRWWQSAVGFFVEPAISQLDKLATQWTRLRPTTAILDVLSVVFCREDQLTVLADTRTTSALVTLKPTTDARQQIISNQC